MNSVFVTFNVSADFEEATALRLQTIAGLYGVPISLPYRPDRTAPHLTSETKRRIEDAWCVAAFSLSPWATGCLRELQYALSVGKPVMIFYGEHSGKNIIFKDSEIVQEIFLDFSHQDRAINQAIEFLQRMQASGRIVRYKNEWAPRDSGVTNTGAAVIGIGLLLLGLWTLTKEEKYKNEWAPMAHHLIGEKNPVNPGTARAVPHVQTKKKNEEKK